MGVYEDSPPLIVRLEMLKKVWRPGLLERFRQRQGAPLEDKLTQWLIRLGPRANATEDKLGRTDAIKVLRKIGGNGFGRVIRHYLDSPSPHSKRDGLEFAYKTPEVDPIG